jgi:hypothetical protein
MLQLAISAQRLVKILYRIILSVGLIGLLFSGCANKDSSSSVEVSFEQLFSNPSYYNGQHIAIKGFVFLGFEVMVLSEELKYSGYAEGHIIPVARMLWVEGGVPRIIYDKLYEQNMIGPSERYGKTLVKGTFQYDGQYGHLGAYEYQITPTEIRLLEWSPPKTTISNP